MLHSGRWGDGRFHPLPCFPRDVECPRVVQPEHLRRPPSEQDHGAICPIVGHCGIRPCLGVNISVDPLPSLRLEMVEPGIVQAGDRLSTEHDDDTIPGHIDGTMPPSRDRDAIVHELPVGRGRIVHRELKRPRVRARIRVRALGRVILTCVPYRASTTFEGREEDEDAAEERQWEVYVTPHFTIALMTCAMHINRL